MTRSSLRTVTARRLVATGAALATFAAPAAHAGGGLPVEAEGEGEGGFDAQYSVEFEGEGGGHAIATPAEGEAEGGAGTTDSALAFQRDLGFMAGHLRAGIELYREGDLAAARTHMGHPIEEKYAAIEDALESLGVATMRQQLLALSAAAEDGLALAQVEALYEQVSSLVDEARAKSRAGARTQLLAMAALTRIAAEEYAAATGEGAIRDLHEYQDAWGFVATVKSVAGDLAGGMDDAQAAAGREVLEQAQTLDAAFGDLQGRGIETMDASLLYAAAARMELAVFRLD